MRLTPKNDYVVCGMESGDVVFLKSWDLSLVQAIVPSVPPSSSSNETPIPAPPSAPLPSGAAGREGTGPQTRAPPPPHDAHKPRTATPKQTSLSSPTLTTQDSKHIRQYSKDEKQKLEEKEPEYGKEVISLAFAPKEQYLIVANRRGDIRLLLMPQSQLLPNFAQFSTAASQVSTLLEQEQAAREAAAANAAFDHQEKVEQQVPSQTTRSAGRLQQVDEAATRQRTPTRTSFAGLMRGLFGARNKKQTK
mmetsp:Transcript_11272/g.21611  ORF Transcript_11272/g.21611 Transcript_11272/m.21611 type:complete len:249 (-) Transcript_11272:157-903(-)|eukprot:CAMPEP_0170190876 /NCGR_PEP_ID=MMETSP0040_2-20121228/50322_1 /TAXON_ID=641309 /ORGANISM="Lotharella oceanica, Strain CCMP622" /LENGTH=248 /DNA_ID=CAMNT_0010438833 /DNA_START=150 /DNA_END=896 /DNA_ORIENTATION=+